MLQSYAHVLESKPIEHRATKKQPNPIPFHSIAHELKSKHFLKKYIAFYEYFNWKKKLQFPILAM